MTDVTGFGLLGHLVEMCEGSSTSANIFFKKVPIITAAKEYLAQNVMPGGSKRNWCSYEDKILIDEKIHQKEAINLLADPQTNGGLLIAADKSSAIEVTALLRNNNLYAEIIGEITTPQKQVVTVC